MIWPAHNQQYRMVLMNPSVEVSPAQGYFTISCRCLASVKAHVPSPLDGGGRVLTDTGRAIKVITESMAGGLTNRAFCYHYSRN